MPGLLGGISTIGKMGSMNAEVVSVDLINLMDEDESNGMFAPVHDESVVDSVHYQLHPEEKLWESYWFSIFSIRTGEAGW